MSMYSALGQGLGLGLASESNFLGFDAINQLATYALYTFGTHNGNGNAAGLHLLASMAQATSQVPAGALHPGASAATAAAAAAAAAATRSGEVDFSEMIRWPSATLAIYPHADPELDNEVPFLSAAAASATARLKDPSLRNTFGSRLSATAPECYALAFMHDKQAPTAPRGSVGSLPYDLAVNCCLYLDMICSQIETEIPNPGRFIAAALQIATSVNDETTFIRAAACVYSATYALNVDVVTADGLSARWPLYWCKIQAGLVHFLIDKLGRVDRPPPPMMVDYYLKLGFFRCRFCTLPIKLVVLNSGNAKADAEALKIYQMLGVSTSVPAIRVVGVWLGNEKLPVVCHRQCLSRLLVTARQVKGINFSSQPGKDCTESREKPTWERTHPWHCGATLLAQQVHDSWGLLNISCPHQEALARTPDGIDDDPTRLRRCFACTTAIHTLDHASTSAKDEAPCTFTATLNRYLNTVAKARLELERLRAEGKEEQAKAFVAQRVASFWAEAKTAGRKQAGSNKPRWNLRGCGCSGGYTLSVPMKVACNISYYCTDMCPLCLRDGARCFNGRALRHCRKALYEEHLRMSNDTEAQRLQACDTFRAHVRA